MSSKTSSLRTSLPRRNRRILHPQLLQTRRTSHSAILQPYPRRLHRLPLNHGKLHVQRSLAFQLPRSHRMVHLRLGYTPSKRNPLRRRLRSLLRPLQNLHLILIRRPRIVRNLQRRPPRRSIPLLRRVPKNLPPSQARNDVQPPARQTIHHPQLRLTTQRREDRDLAGGR